MGRTGRRVSGDQEGAARTEGIGGPASNACAARDWGRVVTKALRALRFAARLKAGRLRDDPHSSHSIFSGPPEKVSEPVVPTAAPDPDCRRTFREGRRRR